MKFGVFANMINQTPSLASWWWFYTKDKENNLISLDESIKVGNFHPQIKHFSKLKTKILRKIQTLQSLSSARGIKDIPKIPLEISSWKHKPIFTEICPTWTWTWVSFSWEFITIAYLSGLVMVWIAFLVHLVDFFNTFYVQVVVNLTVIRFLAR